MKKEKVIIIFQETEDDDIISVAIKGFNRDVYRLPEEELTSLESLSLEMFELIKAHINSEDRKENWH